MIYYSWNQSTVNHVHVKDSSHVPSPSLPSSSHHNLFVCITFLIFKNTSSLLVDDEAAVEWKCKKSLESKERNHVFSAPSDGCSLTRR